MFEPARSGRQHPAELPAARTQQGGVHELVRRPARPAHDGRSGRKVQATDTAEASTAGRGDADPSPLSGTRVFASPFLSRNERAALDAAATPVRNVGPHINLVREGACEDSLVIIVAGWACRYATTAESGRQLRSLLVAGEIGNLDALLFDQLDYGVRTLTQTAFVALPRERALALAAEHRGIAQTLTWLALRENAVLSNCALSRRRTAQERLAHLLCELSVRLDAETGNESSFAFPLTQEQVAEALGLTSVHVNRTMQQLRVDGLVVSAKRTITLPDVATLRRIGDFDPGYLHAEPCGQALATKDLAA